MNAAASRTLRFLRVPILFCPRCGVDLDELITRQREDFNQPAG